MRISTAAVIVCLAATAWLLFPWTAAAEADPPAGVVVAAGGAVAVHRADGAKVARQGFVLQPGDSLVIKQGAWCRGFSPLGEAFDRQGPTLIVFARSTRDNFRNRAAIWLGRQLGVWIGQSRNQPLITRSARDWEVLESVASTMIPAPEGQVRPSRQYFCWKAVDGVDRYTVTIASEDGDELSSTVRGHEYSRSELEPGRTYAWKVRLGLDGADLGSRWSEFRVMTEEEEEYLDESLEGLSDLMAGIVLLAAGLHDEAVSRFDAATAGADDRGAALVWRAQALAAVGLHSQAYEDILQTLDVD